MKTGRFALQVAFPLLFVLFFCHPTAFSEKLTIEEERRIESGAIDAFKFILSLWGAGRFDEIYEYGDRSSRGKMTKEKFVSEMRSNSYRCVLASSWETLRDIEAQVITPTRVRLKATMGFAWRGYGETRFFTQGFRMTSDEGEWRIELLPLLLCPY
jgi:hypothetical protein